MKKTKIIVLLCATLMAGCGQKSETENSAFGRYVEQLDDNRMRQSLHHTMDSDSSRWVAVGALKQYYAKSEKPVWYDRQGVSDDADQLLALCLPGKIEKTRYLVPMTDGLICEVDVFDGLNNGLVLAEIELRSEEQTFTPPPFIGQEVTSDKRYFNSYLSQHPFCTW